MTSLREASRLEDEDSTNILLAADAASSVDRRPPRRMKISAFGAVLVGTMLVAACVVVTRSRRPVAPVSADLGQSASHVIEEFATCGGPFHQCGGQGYAGETCCKAGCVCKPKSDYFAQCVPATQGTQCDPHTAQIKADSIMKGAISWQAKAKSEAATKAERAEKAAVAAESLAKLERKAADSAKTEARASRESLEAIKTGNGADWVTAVQKEVDAGSAAKGFSDEAYKAYQKLDALESERVLAAHQMTSGLTKVSDAAQEEKIWSDNLGDEATWTPITGNIAAPVDDSSADENVEYEAPPPEKKAPAAKKDKDGLVGGVYFTR